MKKKDRGQATGRKKDDPDGTGTKGARGERDEDGDKKRERRRPKRMRGNSRVLLASSKPREMAESNIRKEDGNARQIGKGKKAENGPRAVKSGRIKKKAWRKAG